MKTIRLLTLGLLVSTCVCGAQEFTEPGWFRSVSKSATLQGELDRSQEGEPSDEGGGVGPLSLVSYPEIAEAITPDIQALARGLENDPKKIFDYVHDHIRYVHYFGSKKGAQLTLLERSGNDFDQSALLVALLRAAGHTAGYRFGIVVMPYEQWWDDRDFKHWVGLTKPETNLAEVLDFAVDLNAVRGFPLALAANDGSDGLLFHRVWVKLTLSGTNYWLDPAFKIHYPLSGINLATAMGLNTAELMTAAGGTSNADYVVSLNEASLHNKLRDYTTNFLSYLQSNYPNASVEQILGGQYVEPSVSEPLSQGLAFTDLNAYSTNWDYIPTNLMTSLRVTVDGTNRSLLMPQLQGQKLALTFTTNGLGQLWLEDELLLQKQTSGGSTVDVALSVDHAHGFWVLSTNAFVNTNQNDQAVTNTYQRTNASYAITYAFEPDQEWLRQRQERLDGYRAQGLADNSREIVTETLNVMGLNWMLQTERIPRVLAAQQAILLQQHHRLGRMAQEFGKGYYIDVYQQLSGIYPASGNGTGDLARSDRVFDLKNHFASAAEHGLIEQLQSSNLVASSTVKMLQIGNANGQRTYLAKSSNWSNIQGQLSNYNLNSLKTNYIDKGYSLLLPANGSNLVAGADSWAGYGLVARVATSTNYTMLMLISGGYHGGYAAYPTVAPSPPVISQSAYVQPNFFLGGSSLMPIDFAADPVNMVNGAFHLTTTDLSLGQKEPRGISFTRHYSSTRRHHNLAGMAHGWIHNYYLKADDVSAPLAVLGDTTPAQMAAFVVATKSAFELYNTAGDPKNWAVTSLIAKWGVDQIINNAVSVTLGDGTIQFVKQPDGSFTPPAKSTMTLLKTNGVYWVRERHGNTFKFNGTGLLTNIADQYSQPLTVTYNASNWVDTVKDWTNRTLTFTYSGTPQRLTSVADSAGRSISYGYSTNYNSLGDLTSVTDPESQTSTFLYDTNHQIVATKDALNRVVTANIYDGFGRVIEQYSQGDTNQTWKLYWSGYVNTEEDPAGGKRRFYYDDKRRSTLTQDALGHYTVMLYDGQDHVTRTISQLFAITDFYYDGQHNLIAVNDPLGRQKDLFYDAQDNLVRVWDERGNNSYFGYNAKFQLTGSTNGADDWMTYTYNSSNGTVETKTDPGGTTSYGYDPLGQLSVVTHPGSLGGEGFLNSSVGDVLSRTNGRGFVTSFQYNQRRQLTNTIAPTNLTARAAYDAVGNVFSETDARGFTMSNTWSATRKLLATTLPTTPQGVPVMANVYDQRDWLARTLNPLQQAVNYTNDAAGRLIAVTDPLLRATKFGYDDDNRKTSTTNAANEGTRQIWNKRSELLQVTDPANRIVKRAYDEAGNQTLLTNRNGKIWQFEFDDANRLTNTITPLNRETRLTFNDRGLLSTLREPSTQTATNFYDARGRLTNITDAVGTRIYRHDANNNLTNVFEAGKSNVWTYDAYDRVATYKDADGNLIQYGYDANGNVTSLVYPGGKTVTYAYDSLNRVTNVTDWENRKTALEYDLASRVKKITRPNGTVREINYDAAGQTTNIVERTAGGAPINFFKLKWNAAARMESEFVAPLPHAHTPPARTMTFDDDNRLATFNGANVTNDLDGNLIWGPLPDNSFAAHDYDARNRLTRAGGRANIPGAVYAGNGTTNYTHAAGAWNGYVPVNLKLTDGQPFVTGVASGTVRNDFNGWVGYRLQGGPVALAVSQLGRWVVSGNTGVHAVKLVAASGADVAGGAVSVSTAGAPAGQFVYGTLSNTVTLAANTTYYVVSQEVNGGDAWLNYNTQLSGLGDWTYRHEPTGHRVALTNGASVTRFVVNPNAALSQVLLRVKNGVTNYYVYGAGLLYEADDAGNTRTYHYDYRGSTVALTDGSGTVTDRIEYSPYAATTYRTGTTDTPFLYNGRYGVQTDPNGLLYMRARYYNPRLCRFLNADPSGFSGGLNFYAYVDGNPISYLDPSGLVRWGDAAVAGLGVLGNAVGMVFGGALTLAPEPTMLTKAAGITVFTKSSYGAGANLGNLAAAIMDEQPYSQGSFANDVANVAFPGNSTAQTVATLADIGTDLTAGGIGLTHSLSLLPAGQQSIRNLAYYEIGQKTFNGSVVPAAYAKYADPIERGAAIVASEGWIGALTPSASGAALGIGKTFGTGPTPLGLAGASVANSVASPGNGWIRDSSQGFLQLPSGNK